MEGNRRNLIGFVLCWLGVLALIALACDEPMTEDDANYDPNLNGLSYCELVHCWMPCADGACVDACIASATAEAQQQDAAYDVCLDSCSHLEGEEWQQCLTQTCPEADAAFDACLEEEEEEEERTVDDDPTICPLYQCEMWECTDEDDCITICGDDASEAAIAEYQALDDCRDYCREEDDNRVRPYRLCVDQHCPVEYHLYTICLSMGEQPGSRCPVYDMCREHCGAVYEECWMLDCDPNDTGCRDECDFAHWSCEYNCLANVDKSSIGIVEDLHQCMEANCPNAQGFEEEGQCYEDHCSTEWAACMADSDDE